MPATPVTWLDEQIIDQNTNGAQRDAEIVQLANGNILVYWTDRDDSGTASRTNWDIVGRLYDPSGQPLGNEFVLGQADPAYTGNYTDAQVVPYTNGGFLSVFEAEDASGSNRLTLQLHAADGSVLSVDTAMISPRGALASPSVVVGTDGTIAISAEFVRSGNTNPDLLVRLFDYVGGSLVQTSATIPVQDADLAGYDLTALNDGSFMVTWSEKTNAGQRAFIDGRSIDADGTMGRTLVISLSGTYSFDPSITTLADGGFVVVWTREPSRGDPGGIFHEAFDEDGTSRFAESAVGNTDQNPQGDNEPSVVALADGGYVILWDDESAGLTGQRFDAQGAAVGTTFRGNTGNVSSIDSTSLADGRFATTFSVGEDLFLEIFDPRDVPNDPSDANGIIYGTIGNDMVTLGAAATTIYGWDGDDTFIMDSTTPNAVSNIVGGDGSDTLLVQDANAMISVRNEFFDGVEILRLDGSGMLNVSLFIEGSTDFTTIDFGAGMGEDRINIYVSDIVTSSSNRFSLLDFTILNRGAGDDLFWRFTEATQSVFVRGSRENDYIFGSDFGDNIYLGSGVNVIVGGSGDDTFSGRGFRDTIFGGDGNDTIEVSADGSFASGEGGDDTITGTRATSNVVLRGGEGNDHLISGSLGPNGRQTLEGGAGNDTLESSGRADRLEGGEGADTLISSGSSGGLADFGHNAVTAVYVNHSSGIIVDYRGGDRHSATVSEGDTLTKIRKVEGTAFDDRFIGSTENHDYTFLGEGGDDTFIISGSLDVYLSGGSGTDLADFSGFTDDGIRIDLTTGILNEQNGFQSSSFKLESVENIIATSLDDAITGDLFDNTLNGGGGNDELDGGDGDDMLIGGLGSDDLVGGTGFDVASYVDAASGVQASLFTGRGTVGEAAGDTFTDIEGLTGSAFGDILVGRDGASDTLRGGDGSDGLRGNGGDDFLYGDGGNDLLFSGFGADFHDGGTGVDTVLYNQAGAGVIVRLDIGQGFFGQAEGDSYTDIENVVGTAFRDALTGTNTANRLDGRAGNDDLFGLAGADTLLGGNGNDLLDGGAGADMLDGGLGFDTVSYANSDVGVFASLFTGEGRNGDAQGDRYTDVEALTGSAFNDILVGRDGASDTLSGGAGDDALRGNGGDDVMIGGDGNDLFFSGFGADSHDGGAGTDTVLYNLAGAGIIVRLDIGRGFFGQAEGDSYTNIENVVGTAFRDALTGTNTANRLDGRAGNDDLFGLGGSDTLLGGNGNDKLDGGTGFDVLTGGLGQDTFVFAQGYRADRVTDFTDGDDVLDLSSFGFASFAQVSALASQQGADTVIDFGQGDALRLVGFDLADFDANDVMI